MYPTLFYQPLSYTTNYSPTLFSSFVVIFVIYIWVENGRIPTRKSEEHLNSLKNITGPVPVLPIKLIGNLPQLLPLTRTCDQLVRWAREFPEIFKITGFNMTANFLVSPVLVQQLLRSHDFGHGTKVSLFYDKIKEGAPNGVLVTTGKFWQTQRKLLMKTQSYSNLKAYVPLINKQSLLFMDTLKQVFNNGNSQPVNHLLKTLFFKLICEIVTGNDANNSKDFSRFMQNFNTWKESTVSRFTKPWLLIDPIWKIHPLSKANKMTKNEMRSFCIKEIMEHKKVRDEQRKYLSIKLQSELPKRSFKTLIDDLLDAGVGQDQTVDEVITMIVGGYETMATALHFFCFTMGHNPEAQKRCQEEIDEMFENSEHCTPGHASFEQATYGLKYLERCIQETLRIYPVFPVVGRQLQSPINLQLNNETYHFPIGSVLVLSPLMTHHCPQYFPEPKKFDPDRFLPEEIAKRPKYSYLPFSGGDRSCLGTKLAWLEMKIVAAHLLRSFNIKSCDKTEDIKLLPYASLTPKKDFLFQFRLRHFN